MDDHNLYNYQKTLAGHLNRCTLPLSFPFAPFSLGLFDTDPSRILGFLHHQSLLAEEALRYRGMFLNTKEPLQGNAISEMLLKEQDRLIKGISSPQTLNRNPLKCYPFGIPDLLPATPFKFHQPLCNDYMSKRLSESSESTAFDLKTHPSSSKESLDSSIIKRGGSYLKDNIRFNPLGSGSDHVHTKDKLSSYSSPAIKALHDSMMARSSSGDGTETKCNLCNASFPSTWLLEQHTALQHSDNSSIASREDKSFINEQYRSALANHQNQNNRARIPADKLFTCDVCGMQFRYLKSFKKHRLNHALERIHGKKSSENNNELVSSSNEEVEDIIDLNGMIKDDDEEDDSTEAINYSVDDSHPNIISSTETEVSSQIHENTNTTASSGPNNEIGVIKVRSQSFLQKSDLDLQMPSNSSFSNLFRGDGIGLNSQETSLLNFLRNDATDKQQRDRTNPVSRFACPFCGKCVRSKENLKLHVRKHTGERPFVCLFCGRAFGGKSDLTRHLRIHTGERPYHCEACGKCFARADYLSKHLTTHLHNTSR